MGVLHQDGLNQFPQDGHQEVLVEDTARVVMVDGAVMINLNYSVFFLIMSHHNIHLIKYFILKEAETHWVQAQDGVVR